VPNRAKLVFGGADDCDWSFTVTGSDEFIAMPSDSTCKRTSNYPSERDEFPKTYEEENL